jgi:hypothetical protein
MIKLREVEDTDLNPLADFLLQGFPSKMTKKLWLQKFEFWWATNPAYSDLIPRGWILEKDQEILGFLGNIPIKFMVKNEVRIGVASNSWYVDPSIRGIYSLSLFNKFIRQKNVSLLLFKSNDEDFSKTLSKYKFEEYILPASQIEYFYITNKRRMIYDLIRFIILNGEIPKFCELPELGKRIVFFMTSAIFRNPFTGEKRLLNEPYICSICTFCDEEFSRITCPHLSSYDAAISHDADTLNWLFFSPGKFNRRVVIQCRRSRDSSLAGYMVFDILGETVYKEGAMQLMDCCVKDENIEVLKKLILFAAEIGKINNAPLMILWANSPEIEKYFQNTFIFKRTIRHYRYAKFSGADHPDSERDNQYKVYLSLIYPPQ